ncbi:MAG: NHL repeat-containing protein [Betaproteobacteria bacterium]|nr:NHL repeat-containing protein [Betaproteobacteria bacterium]MDH3436034.1 NHL repeat-containing protein [Betaproteobacteria bacterium]
MRAIVLAVLVFFAPLAMAQSSLKVSQLAEFADGLAQPHDAAFSPDGKLIYLTDMANSRMVVLDAMTLRLVGKFGANDLSRPHDAEFDRAGRLLVADTGNGRVAIYEVKGAEAKLVGELKGLSNPEGVAVAPDGRVFVTNTGGGSVSLFRDGRHERTVGRYGDGESEFASPHDIEAAADGSIYVVDSGNHRVQVFSADMKHRASFGAALKLNEPKYLHFDGEHVWLADEYNHRILLLDRRHRLLGVLGTGQRGRGPNAFYKPEAVLARAPHVWVIDTYNDRIVLLRVEKP